MGIYVFTARFLFEQLCLDATRPGSQHDFGHDIIPSVIDTHRVFAFPFRDENRKQDAYWRDVGTLDAYYEANMDLISVDPLLNMYDERLADPHLPAELSAAEVRVCRRGRNARRGQALDSIVCQGWIVSGGTVGAVDPRPQHAHQQLRPRGGFDPVRRRRHRPPRPESAGRSSTRASTFPPGTEIGYDHEHGPRARLHGQRRGRGRDRQGRRRGALPGSRSGRALNRLAAGLCA